MKTISICGKFPFSLWKYRCFEALNENRSLFPFLTFFFFGCVGQFISTLKMFHWMGSQALLFIQQTNKHKSHTNRILLPVQYLPLSLCVCVLQKDAMPFKFQIIFFSITSLRKSMYTFFFAQHIISLALCFHFDFLSFFPAVYFVYLLLHFHLLHPHINFHFDGIDVINKTLARWVQ